VERLALALLLYTGQRGRSDVRVMGRQHLISTDDPNVPTGKLIRVAQQKTKAELTIPVHPNLWRAIEHVPNDNMTFVITQHGQPFSQAGFGNWFREACLASGLPHCSAHGYVRRRRVESRTWAAVSTK
jgi:integrase